MSNETATKTSDAIQILQAKIEAFNKQWQEYNQNWTNISNITLPVGESIYNKYGVILLFLENVISNGKIIVERGNDNKLYYYLYNLPDNFGIRIKEQNSICYIAKNRIQQFSSGYFVYYNGENFIESQEAPNGYPTIDWDEEEEKWNEPNTNNNTTLVFSGETIYVDEKIIFERKNNSKLYYLYNLPNHFGIRINEMNAICYSKEATGGQELEQDKRFSTGDLIYRDGDNFIITKDPITSGYYFTINPVNRRWIATYKRTFFKEVGNIFGFNFMQRLDSPYTYFEPITAGGFRDYVISDINKEVLNYHGENYGMEAPFHLYTMKMTNNTYEEVYDDQTWYFNSRVENSELKNNLVILHEKPVSAGSFYQLVR